MYIINDFNELSVCLLDPFGVMFAYPSWCLFVSLLCWVAFSGGVGLFQQRRDSPVRDSEFDKAVNSSCSSMLCKLRQPIELIS